ncbi:AIPR family protein [Catellatospora vulcania]|uniref:AIPR family protein n=1 Tax=Catellatospora vulcania TaxID=1460450 RepID=UPI0018AFD293|nr:AIPR family protein [Catellatospora vulcania]
MNSLFKQFHDSEYPGENVDEVFERYAVTQVLKPNEVSADELNEGIVDGDKDGGVDSFFVFLDGTLISPDDPRLNPGDPSLTAIRQNPHLEIFLVQSKNTESWEEAAWEHLLSSLPNLLDVTIDDLFLQTLYRPSVIERTGIVRKAIKSLGPKFPQVTFNVAYVTRALESNITPTIVARGDQVVKAVESRLTFGAKVNALHVGARELYRLAAIDPSKPGVLKFRSLVRENDSYLGVVAIKDYLTFIRSDDGNLREELFEANVRDFEGDNSVNDAILKTLAGADDIEFWWLNNGVTVICDRADSPQNTVTVSGPLIVNGLQTSHVLDRAEKEGKLASPRLDNGIVVRVVVSTDEDIRDRIIAGTNRQTQVPGPALFATQPLQSEIERFLAVHEWYYERRKNRYKNQRMPAKRRISMRLLAQALITLNLGQPDVARARPFTLLADEQGYSKVFPDDLDISAYLVAVHVVKGVDEFLASEEAKNIFDGYTNARFYVAAGYSMISLKLKKIEDLRFGLNFRRLKYPLSQVGLINAIQILADTAASYQKSNPKVAVDGMFKSSDFRSKYFAAIADHNLT